MNLLESVFFKKLTEDIDWEDVTRKGIAGTKKAASKISSVSKAAASKIKGTNIYKKYEPSATRKLDFAKDVTSGTLRDVGSAYKGIYDLAAKHPGKVLAGAAGMAGLAALKRIRGELKRRKEKKKLQGS